MRTAIVGSLTLAEPLDVKRACASCGWEITEVVSGPRPGVEEAAVKWAAANHIPTHIIAAEISRHGHAARRKQLDAILAAADALIVLWQGFDRDILSMLNAAQARSMKTLEVRL
jgi:hypothetical protein